MATLRETLVLCVLALMFNKLESTLPLFIKPSRGLINFLVEKNFGFCLIAPVSTEKRPTEGAQKAPRSYGRQSEGKTIKSLSLDKELVKAAEQRAAELGVSFSQFINDMLAQSAGAESTKKPPRPKSTKPGKKEG